MARGDAISDAYIALAQNGNTDIQPASGDEWLVTAIGMGSGGDIRMRMFDGSNTNSSTFGPVAGNTAVTTDARISNVSPQAMLKLILTNAEYIRMHENNSAATQFGWHGIKIKD